MSERKLLILVVDDTVANRYATRRFLERAGWRVLEAGSAAEARRRLAEARPDLICLDVKLPDVLGFDFARELRADPATRDIPILHISATFTESADQATGLEAGADAYLTFPLDPMVLVATVRALVRMRAAEHRLAEALERERYARQEADLIAESIPQLVWIADAQGTFLSGNSRWRELFGADVQELYGNGGEGFVHPEDVAARLETWHRAIDTGTPYEHEFRLRQRDGTYRWYLGRAQPLCDEGGRVLRWFGTTTDIEEHARLRRELQEAVRSRDDFLAMASHDLRNPLTAVQLTVQALLRRLQRRPEQQLPTAKIWADLRAMDQQLGRMVSLLGRLLDLSQLTAGKLPLRAEEVDLTALAREVAARFRDELARSGSALVLRGEPLVGRWDRTRLEQVIANLLGNAVKYGEGKPIEVSVERNGGWARLTVRDHGPGIAREDQERIFKRFERVSRDGHGRSYGLGLWIVSRVIEALGGRIELASQPGAGAAFVVELPIERAASSRPVAKAEEAETPARGATDPEPP